MKKVGIAYTTKDRIDFTRQTLPPILAEADDFDLFWVDGSATAEGKQYFQTSHPSQHIAERHANVTGGAAAAIQYCWATLYNKGYEYIGLIENDVKLAPGWFKKTMALFEVNNYPLVTYEEPYLPEGRGNKVRTTTQIDIKVGAASARCFTDRIDEKHFSFTTMANVGAGMIIVKRDLIPALLLNWRMPMLWEVQALFKHYTGREYPIPKTVREQDPEVKKDWQFTHDWWFELVLLSKGYVTLACAPSMAYNLDDIKGLRDPVFRAAPKNPSDR